MVFFLSSVTLGLRIGIYEVMDMGYQVIYDDEKTGKRKKRSYLVPFTVAAWTAFLLLVNAYWPEGQEALRRFLIPGDRSVAAAAFDTLAYELMTGEPFGDAVEVFFQEVTKDVQRLTD